MADIHGNWTFDNAKSKLHQFLQMNRIQADYKYTVTGPDHNRSVTTFLAGLISLINFSDPGFLLFPILLPSPSFF